MSTLKRVAPALLLPILLLGAGCSRASLFTNSDSQLTITPVPVVEEVVEIETEVLVDGTYTLDAPASAIVWTGNKRVGATHTGLIEAQTGAVMIEGGTVTGGTMVVDMSTIIDTDLTDTERNAQLVGHLKSDDWFAVATYPTATFALEETRAVVGSADATHEVTGTMTIKGIEQEITFPATFVSVENGVELTGVVILDRSLFDVRYGSDTFFDNLGDELIEDEFTLTLDLLFVVAE